MNRAGPLALTAVFGLVGAPQAAGQADVMRVHVIDVGQGAATLVEFPCAAILVDTGGERWPVEEWLTPKYDSTAALMSYLNGFFQSRPGLQSRLELLILTHPHKDHTRAVSKVISAFRPKSVVYNGQMHGSGEDGQRDARTYAREAEVPSWYTLERTIDRTTGLSNHAIDPVACAPTDPRIRALWGQVRERTDWAPEDYDDENNHSVVVRIDYGEASILFTGDLEETREQGRRAGFERLVADYRASKLLDVDVYHVGHHGSHNGTTPALLEAISPEIAVISAGPACERGGYSAWEHAHPRMVTVRDLEAKVTGARPAKPVKAFEHHQAKPTTFSETKAIYSTGWDGTIALEGGKDGSWSVVRTTGPHECLN